MTEEQKALREKYANRHFVDPITDVTLSSENTESVKKRINATRKRKLQAGEAEGDNQFTPAARENAESIRTLYLNMRQKCQDLRAEVERKNAHEHIPPRLLTEIIALQERVWRHGNELDIALHKNAGNYKQIKELYAKTENVCKHLLKLLKRAIPA